MGLKRIHLHPHDDDWDMTVVCDRLIEDVCDWIDEEGY